MKKYLTFLLLTLYTILFAGTTTVSGKVVDVNNNPISAVNIISGEVGTSSNEDGYFYISVPADSNLTFNHIGYKKVVKSKLKLCCVTPELTGYFPVKILAKLVPVWSDGVMQWVKNKPFLITWSKFGVIADFFGP